VSVGAAVGVAVGASVGAAEGVAVGTVVGVAVGTAVGAFDASQVWRNSGWVVETEWLKCLCVSRYPAGHVQS
jgi:hypothetical protein